MSWLVVRPQPVDHLGLSASLAPNCVPVSALTVKGVVNVDAFRTIRQRFMDTNVSYEAITIASIALMVAAPSPSEPSAHKLPTS
jgi:hypothetical protein